MDSKGQPWMVTLECATRNVANSVISNIRIAELPAKLSLKINGSIRKWYPDKHGSQ